MYFLSLVSSNELHTRIHLGHIRSPRAFLEACHQHLSLYLGHIRSPRAFLRLAISTCLLDMSFFLRV